MMAMITVDMTTKMVIVTIPVRLLLTIPLPMIRLPGRLLPAGRFPVSEAVSGGIAAINWSLQHGFDFLYRDTDILTHRRFRAACHEMVAAARRYQNFIGTAGPDGSSDGWCDLT